MTEVLFSGDAPSDDVAPTTRSGVYCAAYMYGKKLANIRLDDISEYLKHEDAFIWVGLHETDLLLLPKLQEEFGLHQLAIDDANAAHQRPKLEEYGDTVFIVLRTVKLCPDKDIPKFGETHLFLGRRFLVSVRRGHSQSYAKVHERCEQMQEQMSEGPGFAMYALMDFVVDNYRPIIDVLQQRFEKLEDDLFNARFSSECLKELYELKRQLLLLRNAVAPMLDICNALIRFHTDIIPRESRVYFRDIYDHVLRLNEAIDNMRDMVTAAMQVDLAMISVGQNEIVKKLASWGAILAIPTMVFSMYGMIMVRRDKYYFGLVFAFFCPIL
ncbi:MAG: magnesium and cobalt transport protein CorA [Burkholderiaceae bacterium]|nr:magnesium and cobalt transport protein CorA [Burkholderiaceae bacterium]